jgi:hypothetical protein
MDEHGVMGFCCAHGIPAKGLFISMPTPEQFMYYDIALQVRTTNHDLEPKIYKLKAATTLTLQPQSQPEPNVASAPEERDVDTV